MKGLSKLQPWLLAALTIAIALVSWMNTWVEEMKQPDTATLQMRLEEANLVLGPLAVLSFALGVQWLVRRRWLSGVLALPGLPIWCGVLFAAETWLVNGLWIVVHLAPLQGIQPFGPTPS